MLLAQTLLYILVCPYHPLDGSLNNSFRANLTRLLGLLWIQTTSNPARSIASLILNRVPLHAFRLENGSAVEIKPTTLFPEGGRIINSAVSHTARLTHYLSWAFL